MKQESKIVRDLSHFMHAFRTPRDSSSPIKRNHSSQSHTLT